MPPVFSEIPPEKIRDNVFRLIGKDWMLITAGTPESHNTMTASWGGLGVLWSKNVCFCFIRPGRHTFSFVENSDTFTLSFFDEKHRDVLKYCGAHSGRDVNKAREMKLTPLRSGTGSTFFAEARLVVECRKMYWQDIDPKNFLSPEIAAAYPGGDYHRLFVGEIRSVKKACRRMPRMRIPARLLKYCAMVAALLLAAKGFNFINAYHGKGPANPTLTVKAGKLITVRERTAEEIGMERRLTEAGESLKKNPNDTRALNEVGFLASVLGRPDEAMNALNRSIKIDPSDNYALRLMGDAYGRRKEYARAITYYKKVLSLDEGRNPNGVNACLGLYRVYRERHEIKQAYAIVNKAYSLATDSATVADIRARVAAGGW